MFSRKKTFFFILLNNCSLISFSLLFSLNNFLCNIIFTLATFHLLFCFSHLYATFTQLSLFLEVLFNPLSCVYCFILLLACDRSSSERSLSFFVGSFSVISFASTITFHYSYNIFISILLSYPFESNITLLLKF